MKIQPLDGSNTIPISIETYTHCLFAFAANLVGTRRPAIVEPTLQHDIWCENERVSAEIENTR